MDYKKIAKAELRDVPAMRTAMDNIKDRIRSLEMQKTSLRSTSDSTPVQGGGNRQEDRLLNLIVESERLRLSLTAHELRMEVIERGLAALSDQDRLLLETFARNRSGEAVNILSDTLFLERTRVYQLWDEALRRYTIAEFGLVDF